MKKKNRSSGDASQQSYGNYKTSASIEDSQWSKYTNKKGGHGFAAEDANAFHDHMKGRKVDKIGTNNAKSGADRIVNNQAIQTKYYRTANDSLNAAFDSATGKWKYGNQILEVPKDQYKDVVRLLEKKIEDGKIPGVKDPRQAKELVREGSVTYKQAKNIAKAGNIDSLWFDLKTMSVVAAHSAGISFMLQYASNRWNGMDKKSALKLSVVAAMRTGGITLGVGILTKQLLRTGVGRSFAAFSTTMSKHIVNHLYKTDIGKRIVHKLASSLLGKEVAGAAAKNALTKSLRTNIVTTSITTVVMTLPDVYRASIGKRISWRQLGKNLTVNVVGAAGGIVGSYGGAAALAKVGGVIGSFIVPGPGTAAGAAIGAVAGAVFGGVVGGSAGAIGSKKALDLLVEDDAKVMLELTQKAIEALAIDYMCNEEELNEALNQIEPIITGKWLQDMYQSGSVASDKENARIAFAYEAFESIFEVTIKRREVIPIPSYRRIIWTERKIRFTLFIQYLKYRLCKLVGIKTEFSKLIIDAGG